MDEASIVSALQEDLQNYKVKIQIRRKESQLHVLITRSEGDDVDYASLYNIVRARIDKLAIQDASNLIVYGRLSGEKHPEWQKISEIKPQLPLIELDLEEIEELDDAAKLQTLEFPVAGEQPESLSDRLFDPHQDDELKAFSNQIDNDLRIATSKALEQSDQSNQGKNQELESDRNSLLELSNLELSNLDLGDWKLEHQATEKLEDLPLDLVAPPPPPLNVKGRSPATKRQSSEDFDFSETFDQVNAASSKSPMPMPPPVSVTRRSSIVDAAAQTQAQMNAQANSSINAQNKSHKSGDQNDQLATDKANKPVSPYSDSSSMIWSAAFVTGAIAVLGLCGWLVWERSVQQRYLVDARSLANQNLNPQTIQDVDSLVATRNQLQNVITQLEEIPDRPISLYGDAQKEISDLRPKLESFDLKISIEQDANKKIEAAKDLTIEAATIVQNPPHRSTVWKNAQQKRQEALQILGEVPATSVLYADAQNRLKAYGDDLVQINRWVDIQQRAESLVNGINANAVNQLKQLKTANPEKATFINQCRAIIQPQIANADAQRTGITIANLSNYLCAYFWDS